MKKIMKNLISTIFAFCISTLASLPAHSYTQAPEFYGTVGTYGPSDFYVTDLAFDPNGDVFLANLLRYSVDKYSPDGTLLFRIEDPAFKWPRTLTVDSTGRVYVVDNVVGNIRVYSNTDGSLLDVWTGFKCAGEIHADSNDRILVSMNGNFGCPGLGGEVRIYDTNGVLISSFGSNGTGPGQFDRNYGISTSADDSIFVTEVGTTARFQKFSSDGTYQFQVGSAGSAAGQFNGPRSPAIDSNGNIYIADRRNDRIQKFDSTGQFLTMWGSRGLAPEQFFEMDSIEMDANDILWVAGYHKNDIQQFDTNGVLINRWVGKISGDGEFSQARGVGVVAGKLFIVDGNNNRIQVFDESTGVFLYKFGVRAQGPATVFNFPRALATGPDGDLYITDDDNIRRIKPDGTFVQMYPRLAGARSGSLGLVISDDNIIYQSDNGNNRINKIDATTGNLLAQWGSNGTAQGQFKSPRGIAIDSNNLLYVADTGNSRIQIFDLNGVFVNEWIMSTPPRTIAIDRLRNIVYVGDWTRVRAYDYSGTELFNWNSNGTAGGRLTGIYDIALGENGDSIYVSELKKGQVQRFLFPNLVNGAPSYTIGQGPGIYIWQNSSNGEWYIQYNGDKNLYNEYSVSITTTSNITDLRTIGFEGNDNVTINGNTITFTGGAKFGEDGIAFFLDAPGSLSFSVALDGQTTNVPVYLGRKGYVPLASTFSVSDLSGDTRLIQQASFTEITMQANVGYTGESWGAAWGNLNNDIYPDLFVTNHKSCPDLFRNLGDGTFEKISGTAEFPLTYCNDTWHDAHGAAWADFDNDGDQDLINLVDNGPGNIPAPNYFFVNESGILIDRALEFGLDYQYGRGRTALWFDWNNDGKLDLLEPTSRRYNDALDLPTALLQQQPDGSSFINIANDISYGISITTDFALLSDLTGDNKMELVVESTTQFPEVIYETNISPVVDIQPVLNITKAKHTRDAAIYDFTGDLQPDIYTVTGDPGTELILVGNTTIESRLSPKANSAQGITFEANGDITIELYPRWRWNANKVFIGSGNVNPSSSNSFTLSATDSTTWGTPNYTSGTTKGFFVWYDNTNGVWHLDNSNEASTNLVVKSTVPVLNLTAIGFDPNELPGPDQYYVWTPTGYVESSISSGITEPSFARNIAVGDFDNDMDLDMFMATTGSVANRPNIFWENQGDGTFIKLNGFGGEGTLLGRGDTATVADIDLDGNLDVFVTNGKSKEPFDLDGPSQLFHNNGTNNNWLQIDLVGIDSNRDGIGARLFLTAGGKTQLREQNSGVHYRSQNYQRIHFGLGENPVADRLEIRWPSGHVQVLNNISANQLIQVHENSAGPFTPGIPTYIPGTDRGVYVWKETFDGPYKFRAVNKPGENGFEVALLASLPLSNVIPNNLETATQFKQTDNSVYFDVWPSQSQDAGVDVTLAPNSKAIFSVLSSQYANPRQVNIGSLAEHPAPAGWLVPLNNLPLHADVPVTIRSGMVISTDITGTDVQLRFGESGQPHKNVASIISSVPITAVTGVGLEGGDQLIFDSKTVNFKGAISNGSDEINLTLSASDLIGITYQRDGLFQPQRLNTAIGAGHANAYILPPAQPYNKPVVDHATEGGLYIWKDEAGAWTIHAVGGGIKTYFEGIITSDQPLIDVSVTGYEANDILDVTDPTSVLFGLNVTGAGTDTITFTVPDGATVSLNLTGNSELGAEAIKVGANKWPVRQLPLDLSGWQ